MTRRPLWNTRSTTPDLVYQLKIVPRESQPPVWRRIQVPAAMPLNRLHRTLLFTPAAGLIATLGKALAENRLDERLKLLGQPQLLVIDEIGYIPIDRQGANLFFQLVSRRYERGAIILTSNQSLGAWGEVFGDPVIATAILDRLLRHSITVDIKGDSYRLREKLKAGLLKSRGAEAGEPAQSR
jgi:DNA replication protein DnaC